MERKGFDHYLTKFDLYFYENVGLKFDKGKSQYKTKVGAVGTILCTLIILVYTLDKLAVMFSRNSFALNEFVEFDYYDSEMEVGADLDLTFAFGVSSFPATKAAQVTNFEDYGTVQAY